jgi:predicted dehydrogenase
LAEKVAIVGAGLMGKWHSHFARSCGATIDAVVDADETRARQLAESIGCSAVYRHVDQLLSRSQARVIHICTPTQTHSGLIPSCIEAGRHVIVEKPLAERLEIAEQLLDAAQKKGVLLNAVHQMPFQRGFLELLQRKTALGHSVRAGFFTCSAGGTGRSPAERRSVMLEILPHPAALFHHLFNADFRPESFTVQKFTDDDLELSGEISGAYASITISLRGRPTRNELNYVGSEGSAHVDLFHGYALFEGGEVSRAHKVLKPFKFGAGMLVKAGTNLAARAVAQEPAYPGLREFIARFYSAVDGKEPPPVSSDEVIKAARLIDLVRGQ